LGGVALVRKGGSRQNSQMNGSSQSLLPEMNECAPPGGLFDQVLKFAQSVANAAMPPRPMPNSAPSLRIQILGFSMWPAVLLGPTGGGTCEERHGPSGESATLSTGCAGWHVLLHPLQPVLVPSVHTHSGNPLSGPCTVIIA